MQQNDLPNEVLLREVEAVLGRRLEHVEGEVARLRRLSAALAVALVCTGLLALWALAAGSGGLREGRVADVVEARRFLLRDAEGVARGSMGMEADGSVRLRLLDRDARERARLVVLPDGAPGLTLSDRDGRSRAVLGLLPDETSTLAFADRTGSTRTVLGLSSGLASTLVFADPAGRMRVGLGVNESGTPGLTVYEDALPAAAPPEPAPAPADSAAAPGPQAVPDAAAP